MYRTFFSQVVIGLASALLLFSCDGTEEAEPRDYYPLAVGNTWTYQTSEIIFDSLTQDQDLAYQERYEIIDRFENSEGGFTYVIHVSSRSNDADPWEFKETWSAKLSGNELIVSEGNIAYVKLLVPPAANAKWKGNKYNTIESERDNNRVDNYTLEKVREPFNDFSNTVTVKESDDTNIVYKDIRRSVYASNIGMVYRYGTYIEYCVTCPNIRMRISERTKIQTLIDYEVQ